jgi:hypothetical protein
MILNKLIMCNKTIKLSMRDVGIIGKTTCNRPDYKDNLCKKHYKQLQSKLTNWEDRPDYRDCTYDEMIRGCHLKLKTTRIHVIYRFRKNVIEAFHSKSNKWIPTTIEPNNNLFCIKRN